MKSKLFLRNLANRAFSLLIVVLLSGCTSSTSPTFKKESVAEAIQNICKKEYSIPLTAKTVGQTLWLYIPVENMVEMSDKPEKYPERFEVGKVKSGIETGLMFVAYEIKPIEEKEKERTYKYRKEVLEIMGNVWKVLRRVIFSMDRKVQSDIKFYCVVTTDIKNGFVLKETTFYLDLIKVSYNFISWTEYQHRSIQDFNLVPEAIGDKQGQHIEYKNVNMAEFITDQITHRVNLKFQKPEVEKNSDIEKEIIKAIAATVKIYDFKDFTEAQLYNTITTNTTILNRAAIWAKAIEQKP